MTGHEDLIEWGTTTVIFLMIMLGVISTWLWYALYRIEQKLSRPSVGQRGRYRCFGCKARCIAYLRTDPPVHAPCFFDFGGEVELGDWRRD